MGSVSEMRAVLSGGAVRMCCELRCTGLLYSDWPGRTLRCGVEPYEPAYQLWSDGAGKQRYVWLPPGGKIDVKDPNDFVFPIGTRFWKEFYAGPEGNQKLGETRYLVFHWLAWRIEGQSRRCPQLLRTERTKTALPS
jgi:hypothetical protein